MKRKFSTILVYFFIFTGSFAQTNPTQGYTPSLANLAARERFRDMKFGLFIHWGIYSVMGEGEWVMYHRRIPYNNYQRLANSFNPQDFDAKAWVKMAKDAGMQYITITSRHHDGFSMFKTEASPYNIVDATPYHKDPLKELAAEAQKEGIQLHLYYSLLDWGRTDYGYKKKIVNGKPEDTDWNSYITFMKKQLTELITNYPTIKAIWFDGNWERPDVAWHYDEIYSLIHRLNAEILIGNNHHMAPLSGEDFQLFEKDLPGENKSGFRKNDQITKLPLETCETMNNSWGYNSTDKNFKSSKQLIQMLVNAAGRNANLLLNVGPMPNGKIQAELTDTLALVGKWMRKNGKSIHGTRGDVVSPQDWGVVTVKQKILYAHVLTWPEKNFILIPGISQKIKSVSLFADKAPIKFEQRAEGIFVYLEASHQNDTDTVIQLTMK